MGLYVENGIFNMGTPVDLGVDESYCGTLGSYNALIENVINEQSIFDSIMRNEFTEAGLYLKEKALSESAEGFEEQAAINEQIEAFQEASLGGMIQTIKRLAISAAKKIKGIILSFVTKIGATLTRDNKALVAKYKKKLAGKDFSNFKYKWHKPLDPNLGKAPTLDAAKMIAHGSVVIALNEDPDKFAKEMDESDYLDNLLAKSSGIAGTTFSTFKKDAFDKTFEDADKVESISEAKLKSVMTTLENSASVINKYKQLMPKIDKVYNDIINTAKRAETSASNSAPAPGEDEPNKTSVNFGEKNNKAERLTYGKGKGASSSQTAIKILRNIQKFIGVIQKIQTLAINTDLNLYKFHVKQCRRVFVKAAAYNPKRSTDENALLLDAVGEAVDYEFDSSIEALEY